MSWIDVLGRPWALAAELGLALLLNGGVAWAQRADQSATAEALFQEARTKLEAGQASQACPLLEASQRVDAAIGTQLLLAHCYEQQGKTASAWALFREVDSLAGDRADRRELAQVRAIDLEKRLSKLIISIDATALGGIELDALNIERDASPLPHASLGLAVPVDPGEHRVRVWGAGLQAWEQSVDVPLGPSVTRLIVRDLKLAPKTAVAIGAGVGPAGRQGAAGLAPDDGVTEQSSAEPNSDWKYGPWITGGVGALGLVVAGGLAWSAQSSYDASLEHCRQERLCDSRGLQLRSVAYDHADWATASSLAGVSLIGAAALWYLLDSDEPKQSASLAAMQPEIGFQTLGVSIRGVL